MLNKDKASKQIYNVEKPKNEIEPNNIEQLCDDTTKTNSVVDLPNETNRDDKSTGIQSNSNNNAANESEIKKQKKNTASTNQPEDEQSTNENRIQSNEANKMCITIDSTVNQHIETENEKDSGDRNDDFFSDDFQSILKKFNHTIDSIATQN